jgi:hypothetical protein
VIFALHAKKILTLKILKETNQTMKIVSQVIILSKIFILTDLMKFIIIYKILETTIENLPKANNTSSEDETSDSDSEYDGYFVLRYP